MIGGQLNPGMKARGSRKVVSYLDPKEVVNVHRFVVTIVTMEYVCMQNGGGWLVAFLFWWWAKMILYRGVSY